MKTSAPLSVEGLDHLVLRVSDIERSLHFYVGVLGLRLERFVENQIYQLRCGRNLIDLQLLPAGSDLSAPSSRSIDHVCVNIRGEMEEVVEYMKENGVTIDSGPIELYGATGYGTSIYVLDPDGHRLELKTDHTEYPIRLTSAQQFLATLSRGTPVA